MFEAQNPGIWTGKMPKNRLPEKRIGEPNKRHQTNEMYTRNIKKRDAKYQKREEPLAGVKVECGDALRSTWGKIMIMLICEKTGVRP